MNDNSDFYNEDRAVKEEIDWILHRPHGKIIDWLTPRMEGIETVIEFGCGSGIIAAALPMTTYTGIDANPHFLRMARKRCPDADTYVFTIADIRDYAGTMTYDLSMAWSFLKHFGIHEWNDILCTILQAGKFAAFNAQMIEGDRDLDNGTDYHHVHITERRLAEAIKQAGHREVDRTVLSTWAIENRTAKDVALWTKRS